jgi:hypothetical protein
MAGSSLMMGPHDVAARHGPVTSRWCAELGNRVQLEDAR